MILWLCEVRSARMVYFCQDPSDQNRPRKPTIRPHCLGAGAESCRSNASINGDTLEYQYTYMLWSDMVVHNNGGLNMVSNGFLWIISCLQNVPSFQCFPPTFCNKTRSAQKILRSGVAALNGYIYIYIYPLNHLKHSQAS